MKNNISRFALHEEKDPSYFKNNQRGLNIRFNRIAFIFFIFFLYQLFILFIYLI